jgi:hypothetical protein
MIYNTGHIHSLFNVPKMSNLLINMTIGSNYFSDERHSIYMFLLVLKFSNKEALVILLQIKSYSNLNFNHKINKIWQKSYL